MSIGKLPCVSACVCVHVCVTKEPSVYVLHVTAALTPSVLDWNWKAVIPSSLLSSPELFSIRVPYSNSLIMWQGGPASSLVVPCIGQMFLHGTLLLTVGNSVHKTLWYKTEWVCSLMWYFYPFLALEILLSKWENSLSFWQRYCRFKNTWKYIRRKPCQKVNY